MKVLAAGTFNLLHRGHVPFLDAATRLGDDLVVVVATDRMVSGTKGYLTLPARERATLVGSLRCVDKARIGNEGDILRVLEEERPDIIALGYDQQLDPARIKKRCAAIGLRCRVVRLPRFGKWSSRALIRNARTQKGKEKGKKTGMR